MPPRRNTRASATGTQGQQQQQQHQAAASAARRTQARQSDAPDPEDDASTSESEPEPEQDAKDWDKKREQKKEKKNPVKFANPASAPQEKRLEWAERALLPLTHSQYVNKFGLKMRPLPGHRGRLTAYQKQIMRMVETAIEKNDVSHRRRSGRNG